MTKALQENPATQNSLLQLLYLATMLSYPVAFRELFRQSELEQGELKTSHDSFEYFVANVYNSFSFI